MTRLLDLFCGAGGAAAGYHSAGFDVVGVDIAPQPRYPFKFVQADALTADLDGFDVIHASPPCQAYSASTVMHDRSRYPDLVPVIREHLAANGTPYIIENVPGAPLRDPVMVCASGLGNRRLTRHRLFESNLPLVGVPCRHDLVVDVLTVVGHSEQGRTDHRDPAGTYWGHAARCEAMGIDWMRRDELCESIPPTYTEHLGRQMIELLRVAA